MDIEVFESTRLHHIGIATADVERDGDAYCAALGLPKPGACVTDPENGVRVRLLSSSGTLLEFVQPYGERSPVSGVLQRGGGLYHVGYSVEDLGAAVRGVRARGATLISPIRPAVAFQGRRVAFVRLQGNIVELVESCPR